MPAGIPAGVLISVLALSILSADPVPANETFISPLDVHNPGEYATFQPKGDIRRFLGETLSFDISFLWFENAAEATVGLYEKNGVLYSVLEAKTKGFVGFFTAYRKHVYIATFDVIDNGTRVRSKKFEREVTIGDQIEQTQNYFDYDNHINWWHSYVNNEKIESGSRDIPKGINFDDILAALYNFRNSVYGPLNKDAKFVINTIPEKGVDTLSVHIKGAKEEEEFRQHEGRAKGDELLLQVIIPKEIFKTENGELLFWSSKHYVPLETTVKNYILLGDLHAKFRKRDVKKTKCPLLCP